MINHYTSVAALAHILESGRVRFSRLDRFDDVQEAQVVAGINFGAQLFASCWVRKGEEDIPQWAMYGDRMAGVRITLPDDPFRWRVLHGVYPIPGCAAKWKFDQVLSPFSVDDLRGNGYIVIPEMLIDGAFLRDVIYVDDVADAYKQHVEVSDEVTIIRPAASELARYKSRTWDFQRECRFVISTKRGPTCRADNEDYGSQYMQLVANPDWNRLGALAEHIDVELDPDVLSRVTVTLGPLSTPADRIIVEALLSRFAGNATLRVSDLSNLIRPKP
ncbi:hypothetical protein E4582_12600 [Luteimonas yindakuii]|uniref:DUF2971 domain-containing protein n=1 Tax=Luteimonas yindakuii TaxID=2565782 RepID=A0A4Z1R280_9GAMM|nr:hypothetical protein [Luteimonas yindakuii]TKS53036.1 hypothetical protein E4582_12600 [Luteimonas yindakuii]